MIGINHGPAPKYSLGMYLGTTHCALSYVDISRCDGEQVTQSVLPIPQLTAPGTVESLGMLPSFVYLPHADEMAPALAAWRFVYEIHTRPTPWRWNRARNP